MLNITFKNLPPLLRKYRQDTIAVALIGAILGICFVGANVNQLCDSNFSMLTGESIMYHRSPNLNDCMRRTGINLSEQYQLYKKNDNEVYYGYPIGSSILLLPMTCFANVLGYRALAPDAAVF